ncbi:PBPRA1643 family SWIM/SEC-C metal-binding motif protein [Photobacterium sp. TY1-4]|uniref:PBPRA1643 family SWIM/SEC-C metal-binding motif protein n=1 Tax=Photobacterium sp. TY1-4 TaxID=2899122 RepID=UPI0021C20E7D|nr:PBPRA1643 family SWIM/SEC-C metal-binding motif protein [Photobacterium sp. TY1-4]UXI03808.1 SEC-C metal-binding domain-containing protein [Photobacterium sp. TY1-4]
MSKFFFKGRIEKKPKHESFGYNTKRTTKLGSKAHPLLLSVQTNERKEQLETRLNEHGLFATIEVNAEQPENIQALDALLKTPKTTTFEKTPNRNDPCSCGSQQKYKKCCGK